MLWASVPDWRLPAYFDLTPYLQPGRNIIALWVREVSDPGRGSSPRGSGPHLGGGRG